MDQVAIDGGRFQATTSPKIGVVDEGGANCGFICTGYCILGGGLNLWVFGVLVTLKVLSNETTGGSYSVFEDLVPAGAGPPEHIHTREDESWYVLEGELMWKVGGKTFHAKKGSFIHLPRLVPHTFSNPFDTRAKMLVNYAPGGFEEWFLEVGTPASFVNGNLVPPEAQTAEEKQRGVKLMQEYGIVFHNTDKEKS